ncbi:MAG: cytochrome c biogenesis protein CcdA [Desulfofustis sp.]|nr:cytochrome c biogenesis protein CcdA [Desulfofustis sp.]
MMDVQVFTSGLLAQLAGWLQVGYAFGAGMVSAVNPCGFAMLPVYLSLYLGAGDQHFQQRSWPVRLGRAVGVALVVSAGYGVLFGVIGMMVSAGGSLLLGLLPWVSVGIGIGLLVLGFWMLLGKHVSLDIMVRLSSRIGDPRTISIRGFFLFGLAFGATSLGCTLPIFLVVVGNAVTSGDFMTGMVQFFWYILGSASVFLLLTLAMAFVKGGIVVGYLRRMVPYVHVISSILLILAGGYICYYWLSSGLLIEWAALS